MPSREFHFKSISIVKGDMRVEVSLERFEGQFQRAQYYIDSTVMASMERFMPKRDGIFINNTKAMSASLAGTGTVVAAAPPFGRYLYEGKVMVDSVTGKGPRKIPTGPNEFVWRYKKGAKLVPSSRDLNYFKDANPDATDHWFDAAKEQYKDDWIKGVKRIAGGGHAE